MNAGPYPAALSALRHRPVDALPRSPNLLLPEAGVVAAAAAMAWAADHHPALVPAWGPWDFSWPAFLAAGFSLLWFVRGAHRAGTAGRLPRWRTACFLTGVAGIYVVLLTHFEYAAQHMFVLNRVQHAVMHHLGPFMIALSWPGATIARGMPPVLRRGLASRPIKRILAVLQQPLLAVLLFEGLLMLWLVPPVLFAAMFDPVLYGIMNISMVVDGLLFWFLVLDPRPRPQAPIGFYPRLALAFLIIFPQIAVGTAIGLAGHDLYPSFALCGRIYPAIGPLADQQLGGLVLWIPAGMMSAFAAILIMWRMVVHEDSLARLPA